MEADKQLENHNTGQKAGMGVRHTLALMCFIGYASAIMMRAGLSVSIVAMEKKEDPKNKTVEALDICPVPQKFADETKNFSNIGEFSWDPETRGLILGGFFYGYTLTNCIGGRAADYWGGRVTFGAGIVAAGIINIFLPFCARISHTLLIAARILQGCCDGVAFPSVTTIIAKWYPKIERSKFTGVILSGNKIGTVLSLSLSGWICSSEVLEGWPTVFYLFGSLALVWGCFWFLLIYETPERHPRISRPELEYIRNGCPAHKRQLSTPWKSILLSKAFWAIAVAHFGMNWSAYVILIEFPSYFDKVLHINISNNGVFSSLPYLAAWAFSIFYGLIMDRLIFKGILSIISVRRLSMVIGGYVPTLAMIFLCFVGCNSTSAISVLVISGISTGALYYGVYSSHPDIAPRFAGTLMGLTNTLASIPGFTVPLIASVITQNDDTISAWNSVFIIAAVVIGIANTFYLFFVTTDVQPWNDIKTEGLEQTERQLTQY